MTSRKALLAAWLLMALPCASPALANEIVDQNPFAPDRKPWKQEKKEEEPAPLPELTPKDLQIDAIIVFGQFKGIVAQLDGRLKGTLPANAAGKVRIQVGQNFGGGYVLAALDANQVTVQAGRKRFTVPLLRKMNKGGPPPAPVLQAQEQVNAQQAAANAPAAAPPPALPVPPPAPIAAPAAAGTAPPSPFGQPQTGDAAAQTPGTTQPPNSLMDAILRAQETSRARGASNAQPQGVPFGKP